MYCLPINTLIGISSEAILAQAGFDGLQRAHSSGWSAAAILFPFLMPRKQRECWSCSAAGNAAPAHKAAIHDKHAWALFLCKTCWECRHCTAHRGDMLTFLDDMPLSQRRASKSPHKPLGETVTSGNSWCTVCTNYCASACNQCLSEAELSLRAKGVTRCSFCEKTDLIVKGADRMDGTHTLRLWHMLPGNLAGLQ